MIKHIVLFKLKEFDAESQKVQVMKQIKTGLESLKDKIDVIRKINVEFNANSSEEYDLALVVEFDNLKDLETYATHPEHVKVSQFVVENRVKRACVDYEFNNL